MFAYCNNNPVNCYDPTGKKLVSVMSRDGGGGSRTRTPAWEVLGFEYNSSAGEFHKLETGEAPESYKRWLREGGTITGKFCKRTYGAASVYISSVTLIPNHKISEYMVDKYVDDNSDLAIDVGTSFGGFAVKGIASKLPAGMGTTMNAASGLLELVALLGVVDHAITVAESNTLKEIYAGGQHAVIVTTSCNLPGSSATAIYPFDGKSWTLGY